MHWFIFIRLPRYKGQNTARATCQPCSVRGIIAMAIQSRDTWPCSSMPHLEKWQTKNASRHEIIFQSGHSNCALIKLEFSVNVINVIFFRGFLRGRKDLRWNDNQRSESLIIYSDEYLMDKMGRETALGITWQNMWHVAHRLSRVTCRDCVLSRHNNITHFVVMTTGSH
mgnify:CR=1 FL=1